MNVTDVLEEPTRATCRLEEIFRIQAELKEKYADIERKNGIGLGLLPEEFSLDDSRCQYVMKDYAWRVIEEVGEALDAVAREGVGPHAKEEVADGFHFLIELCHMLGVGPEDVCPRGEDGKDRLRSLFMAGVFVGRSSAVSELVRTLGMACCCLKNKPWKQTQFRTDAAEFRARVVRSFRAYIDVAISFEMTAGDLFDMYFRKSRVNDFRIRSKY